MVRTLELIFCSIAVFGLHWRLLKISERDSTVAELKSKDIEMSNVLCQIEELKTVLKEEETRRNEYVRNYSFVFFCHSYLTVETV